MRSNARNHISAEVLVQSEKVPEKVRSVLSSCSFCQPQIPASYCGCLFAHVLVQRRLLLLSTFICWKIDFDISLSCGGTRRSNFKNDIQTVAILLISWSYRKLVEFPGVNHWNPWSVLYIFWTTKVIHLSSYWKFVKGLIVDAFFFPP